VKTIEEAREFLREKRHEGATCPCCKQHVKVYLRTINAGMAVALILISRTPTMDNDWVDIRQVVGLRGGDYAKLRYWRLLEQNDNYTGVWRLTQRGLQFLNDRLRVCKTAHVYNGEVLKMSGEDVSIRQALGNKFDYAKLMAGIS
jgi:hypothetical protein